MAERAEAVLAAIFQAPNGVSRNDATDPGSRVGGELAPFLARMAEGRATLLPWVEGGKARWYALAFSARQGRLLREDIQAHLAHSYARVRPLRPECGPSAERAILAALAPWGEAFRIEPPPDTKLRNRLVRMLTLLEEREQREVDEVESAGTLLRDLERALAAEDAVVAGEALAALRRIGGLDPRNALFLLVRVLVAAGQWARVLEDEELAPVVQMRLPRRVAEGLAQALYWEQIARHLSLDGDPDDAVGAVALVDDLARGRFALLLRQLETPERVEARVVAAVALAARGDLTAKRLAELAGADRDAPWAAAMFALVPRKPEAPSLSEQIPTTEPQTPSPTRADVPETLERFREDRTLGRAAALLAALGLNAASPRSAAEQDLVGQAQRWRGRAGAIPTNWSEWATACLEDPGWAGAEEVARRGADEWELSDLAAADAAGRFASRLSEIAGHSRALLQVAVSGISDRLADLPSGPQLADLRQAMSMCLLLEGALSDTDWNLLASVLEPWLAEGPDAVAYGQVMGDIADEVRERGSASTLESALEFLDLLARYPAPDASARDRMTVACAERLKRHRHRRSAAALALFRFSAPDLGEAAGAWLSDLEQDAPAAPEPATVDPLEGTLIGLYSLDERALARARAAIAAEFPGADVRISAAKVATHELTDLARRARLMVVATRAAKHAATDAIGAARASDAPTRYALGKGASSLLREVRAFAAADLALAEGSVSSTRA